MHCETDQVGDACNRVAWLNNSNLSLSKLGNGNRERYVFPVRPSTRHIYDDPCRKEKEGIHLHIYLAVSGESKMVRCFSIVHCSFLSLLKHILLLHKLIFRTAFQKRICLRHLDFPTNERGRENEIPLCTGNSFLANCRWRPRRFPEESSKKKSPPSRQVFKHLYQWQGKKTTICFPENRSGEKVSLWLCRIEEKEERPFYFFPSDRLLFYLFSMTATERWKQHGYKTTIRKL